MFYLTLGLLIFSLSIYKLYTRLKVPKELKHIPEIPLWETILSIYYNQPLDVLTETLHQKYFDQYGVARMWFLGKWIILVTDEETVKKMMFQMNDFPKVDTKFLNQYSAFSKFTGRNLAVVNGEEWKIHRKVINPIFKRQFDTKLFGSSVKSLFKEIERKEFKNIEINKYMQRLSIDILGKSVFDLDFNSIENPKVEFIDRYTNIMSSGFTVLNLLFPFLNREWNPIMRQAHLDVKWFRNEFKTILNQKRETLKLNKKKDSELDLLSSMIKAVESSDSEFTEENMMDNCMVFFLAGHDTTATALTSALHFLALNPEVQTNCRNEIKKLMDKHDIPTNEEIRQMTYLSAVIKESMRLYPPASRLTLRMNKKELTIGNITIPEHSFINANIMSLCREEKVFEDAKRFNPSRFLNNESYGIYYSPFSNGIGMNFSLDEQKTVLSMILSKFLVSYNKENRNDRLPIGFPGLLRVGPVKLDFTPIN